MYIVFYFLHEYSTCRCLFFVVVEGAGYEIIFCVVCKCIQCVLLICV